jgi:hypothetical protein
MFQQTLSLSHSLCRDANPKQRKRGADLEKLVGVYVVDSKRWGILEYPLFVHIVMFM